MSKRKVVMYCPDCGEALYDEADFIEHQVALPHKHVWALAEYYQGHLIDVSDKAKSYKPPEARWLCPCGVQKLTEVSDLVATDNQSQVEHLKSAQSDPKRKANT